MMANKLTVKRLEKIADELTRRVGSFVEINGERCYIGNIFDLPGNREHFRVGAALLVVKYPLADWKKAEMYQSGITETVESFEC